MSQRHSNDVSNDRGTGAHDATPSEEILMARAQAGDTPAFEALALRLQPRLYSFIFRWVRDGHTAEDLVQETLLRVFKERARFKPGKRVSTWVFSVALNLCHDLHRRKRPTGSLEDPLVSMQAEASPYLAPRPGPDQEAENAEIAALLVEALAELPPTARKLLQMRESGLTLEQAGKKVGISGMAARASVSRAYRQLKEILSGKLRGPKS